jgi:hypothetical protein
MEKYYRVLKDTFMWEEGAILKLNKDLNSFDDEGGYEPIEDIWNTTPENNEYVSTSIIENEKNSQYFQRVYKVGLKGMIFNTADQIKEKYKTKFKR